MALSPPFIPHQSVSSPMGYGDETNQPATEQEQQQDKFFSLRHQSAAARASNDVFAYSNVEGPDPSYPEVLPSRGASSRKSSLGRVSQTNSRSSHIYCPSTGTYASYLGNTVKKLSSPLSTASEIIAAAAANVAKNVDDEGFANITEHQEAPKGERRKSISFGDEEMTSSKDQRLLPEEENKIGQITPASRRSSIGGGANSISAGTPSNAPSYFSRAPISTVDGAVPPVVPNATTFSVPTYVEDTKTTSFEMQAMNRWQGVYFCFDNVANTSAITGEAKRNPIDESDARSPTSKIIPLYELTPPSPVDLKKSPFLMPMLPRLVDPDVADEANSFAIGKKREMLGLVRSKDQKRKEAEQKAKGQRADMNRRGGAEHKQEVAHHVSAVEMREVDPAMMTTGAEIGGKKDPKKRRGSTGIISGTSKEHAHFGNKDSAVSGGGFFHRIGKAYAKMKANLDGVPAANRFYLFFPELSRGIVGTAVAQIEERASIAESRSRRNSTSSAASFAKSASSSTGGRLKHRFSHDLLDMWVGEFQCTSIHRNTAIEGFVILTDKHLCFVSERGLGNTGSYFSSSGSGIGGGTSYQVRSVVPYTDILGIEECTKDTVGGVAVTVFNEEDIIGISDTDAAGGMVQARQGDGSDGTVRRSSSLGAVQTFYSWHDSVNNSAEDHSANMNENAIKGLGASASAFVGPNHGFEYANDEERLGPQGNVAESMNAPDPKQQAQESDQNQANIPAKRSDEGTSKSGSRTPAVKKPRVVLLPTGAPAKPKYSTVKTTPLYFAPLMKRGPECVPFCLQIYLRDGSLLQLFDFKNTSLFDKEPTQNYAFPLQRDSASRNEIDILYSMDDLASYTYFSPSAAMAKLRSQVHYLNGVRPPRRVDDTGPELSRDALRELEEKQLTQLASTQKRKLPSGTSSNDPMVALQEFFFGKSRTLKPSSLFIQMSQSSFENKSKSNPLSLNWVADKAHGGAVADNTSEAGNNTLNASTSAVVGYSCDVERQRFYRKSVEIDRFEALLEYYWRRELYLQNS